MKSCNYCRREVTDGRCSGCGAPSNVVYSSPKQGDPKRQYRVSSNGEFYRVEYRYWKESSWWRKAGWADWQPVDSRGEWSSWGKEYETVDQAKLACDKFAARFGCWKSLLK